MSCEHLIGLLNDYDNTSLVCELEFKYEIFEGTFDMNTFKNRDYTQEEKEHFFDFRYNTHIQRFKFCPNCGEKINWAEIKKAVLGV